MSPSWQPWLNESLCWRKRYHCCIFSPRAVICQLVFWIEGTCQSFPGQSWIGSPKLPGHQAACSEDFVPFSQSSWLSPLPQTCLVGKHCCGLTPVQGIGGEDTCYKITAHLSPPTGIMKFRELLHHNLWKKAPLQLPADSKQGHTWGNSCAILHNAFRTFIWPDLHVFWYICHRHVSAHFSILPHSCPPTVSFSNWSQKVLLWTVSSDALVPSLADRANVETFIMYKQSKSLRALSL